MRPESTLEERIRNRNSWLGIALVGSGAGLLLWKLGTGTISIATVGVTDFLAIVLSLFAIGLSVAFYFKATDTSNLFYDNTYKFTKEISEILGRIEAGFGERLRHLDEGYSGLRDSFARLPLDMDAATRALKEEEATAKKLEKERKDLLAHLADRAKLQAAERKDFFSKLKEKEQEVRQARAEVSALRRQLDVATPASSGHSSDRDEARLRRMESYIMAPHRRDLLQPVDSKLSLSGVRDTFGSILPSLNPQFVSDMHKVGFLNEHSTLTVAGARWLRGLLLHGQRSST